MSRAGRKRKAEAPRKRGRIDWRAANEDPRLVATWNAARDAYLAFGRQPRLATQAGRLFVFRHLNAYEIEAAERWCELLATYDRIVLSRTRSVQPSSLERLGVTLGSEWDEERIQQFRGRFDAAQNAVLTAGKPALTALNRLCRDEAGAAALPEARKGLAQLVAHFRLDTTAKSVTK